MLKQLWKDVESVAWQTVTNPFLLGTVWDCTCLYILILFESVFNWVKLSSTSGETPEKSLINDCLPGWKGWPSSPSSSPKEDRFGFGFTDSLILSYEFFWYQDTFQFKLSDEFYNGSSHFFTDFSETLGNWNSASLKIAPSLLSSWVASNAPAWHRMQA